MKKRLLLIKQTLKEERGDMKTFVTLIGLALVSAIAIGAAIIYAPETTKSLFDDAIQSIRGELGL